jgi:IclR family transcriptional regulator, KDG regulon repressor
MTTDSMQTISRSIQILKSFSREEKEISLAELHRKLGLSKSSIQRILNTLVTCGFLEKDNQRKTYKLGIELYYLGKLVEGHSHLITVSKPYLTKLRDRFGETVYLNVIENDLRKCIAFEEAKHDLMTVSYVGQTSPLYAGASAKLLLAYLSTEKKEQYFKDLALQPVTESTITDVNRLKDELRKIQKNGYAISYGERVMGIFSVSAPIKSSTGEVVAGISIAAPSVRVDDKISDEFIKAVQEIAEELSNELKFKI